MLRLFSVSDRRMHEISELAELRYNGRVKLKNSGKARSTATLFTINSTRIELASNPVTQGEKTTINRIITANTHFASYVYT